ncbi:MAG: hypothetical protein U1E59_08095 [Amaricoccus sp.]
MAPNLRHAEDLRWFLVIPASVDPRAAGILEWRIAGGSAFIVRATDMARAIRQYEESVRRLGLGLPHRTGAYRPMHHALRSAADAGTPVTVTALETCRAADLAARKAHWQALRAVPGADA